MSRYREWLDRSGPFDTCYCDGAWWSIKGGGHRRGSIPLCIHADYWLVDEGLPLAFTEVEEVANGR